VAGLFSSYFDPIADLTSLDDISGPQKRRVPTSEHSILRPLGFREVARHFSTRQQGVEGLVRLALGACLEIGG